MKRISSPSKRLGRWIAAASLVAAASTFVSGSADAHFILKAPASWMSQTSLGNPQKLGPCGDEGGGTPSGQVTAFQEGQTITITIDETIFHPGHYRIALAKNDPSELPAEPVVTPNDTPCGTVPIQNPPVFPVLADGVLVHTAPFNGPQTFQVTLPAGVTCEKCTLQVIEFMSNHPLNNPGGCFYHHCANISVNASSGGAGGTGGTGAGGSSAGGTGGAGGGTTGTTTSTDAGGSGGAGAAGGAGGSGGAGGKANSPGGCGCSMPGGDASSLGAIASVLGLALLRRRRRR